MQISWIYGLAGGALIAVAVTLMLLLNGRVTGISGIANGLMSFRRNDSLWRLMFVSGLIVGGLLLRWSPVTAFEDLSHSSLVPTLIAGLLVGFGTVMASGCTSGHGVCGLSRLSPRSLIATLSFIGSGALAVFLTRYFLSI